jgi:hypothetical protein
MLIELRDIADTFENRFKDKKKDKFGRFKVKHDEIFSSELSSRMWKFLTNLASRSVLGVSRLQCEVSGAQCKNRSFLRHRSIIIMLLYIKLLLV